MTGNGATNKLLLVDIGRCLGCLGCRIACAVEHSASRRLRDAIDEYPRPASRVTVEAAGGLAVPLHCRHCEDAPCVAVCPAGAIEKLGPHQPVVANGARCIGCRLCIVACPFGAVQLRSDGKAALKCDLCVERLRSGGAPACVEACATGALRLARHEDIVQDRRRLAADAAADAYVKARAAGSAS